MTSKTSKSIDVDIPVDLAYELWTDFESYSKFMRHVDEVTVLEPGKLHWKVSLAGVEREWDAEVTSQIPGETIAWQSTSGTSNSGRVDFEELSPTSTRIHLDLHFEPEGFVEKVGEKLGFAGDGAEGDLRAFKKYAEELAQDSVAIDEVLVVEEIEIDDLDDSLGDEQPYEGRVDGDHTEGTRVDGGYSEGERVDTDTEDRARLVDEGGKDLDDETLGSDPTQKRDPDADRREAPGGWQASTTPAPLV